MPVLAGWRAIQVSTASQKSTRPARGSTNEASRLSCSNLILNSRASPAVRKLRSCWPLSSQYRTVNGLRALGFVLFGRSFADGISGAYLTFA